MTRTEPITTSGQLAALAPEWTALWDRCPAATPFQSPEWLLPWWELFHPGQHAGVALRSGGRLVGLAPIYTDGRTARLLGAGISDYLDVLLEPQFASGGARLIYEHLVRTAGAWDTCEFQDLRAESPLLSSPLPRGLAASSEIAEVCPVLEAPATWPELLSGLPSGLRYSLRRQRERLSASRPLRFESAREENLPEYLESLFRLHGARWEARSGRGVLAGCSIQEFHRRAAPGLLARGWLHLHGLRVDGALGAVLYGFACRGRLYLYLSGFEPSLARFSPGALLLAAAIEHAIAGGMRRIDFLRGNEAYKYAWGARDVHNRRLVVRRV